MKNMKHLKLYDIFLNENLAVAKSKYVEKLKDISCNLNDIKMLDPSNTFKYIQIICKYTLDKVNRNEIKKYINLFHKHIKKIEDKDINNYKDFNKLKYVIDNIKKSKKERIEEIKDERRIILDNENFLIFEPISWRSACKYGMKTKWCISARDDKFMWYALMDRQNYISYFIIVKNKEISDRLYKRFSKRLELESALGEQGDINSKDNFEKMVVLVRAGSESKQVWVKSNHMVIDTKRILNELDLDISIFSNNNPVIKNVSIDNILKDFSKIEDKLYENIRAI